MEPLSKLATKRALYLHFTPSSITPLLALRLKHNNHRSIPSTRITTRFSYPISQASEIERVIRTIASQQAPFAVQLSELAGERMPGGGSAGGLVTTGLSYRTKTEGSDLAALLRDLERELRSVGMVLKMDGGKRTGETGFGIEPKVLVAGGMSEAEAEGVRREILREAVELGPLVADAVSLGFSRPKGHRWKVFRFEREGAVGTTEIKESNDALQGRSEPIGEQHDHKAKD